jgi:hypothetical protein
MLFFNFLKNKLFHIRPIEAYKVLTQFFLNLVQTTVFCIFHLLPNGITVFIDNNQNFFGFGHLEADCFHNLSENVLIVDIVKSCVFHAVSHTSERSLSLYLLFQIGSDIVMEKIDCNFENLVLIDSHHHQQISKSHSADAYCSLITRNSPLQP